MKINSIRYLAQHHKNVFIDNSLIHYMSHSFVLFLGGVASQKVDRKAPVFFLSCSINPLTVEEGDSALSISLQLELKAYPAAAVEEL